MSTDASGIASAQVGQWNVESNSTTSAALKEALSEHPEAKKGSDGQPKPEEAKPDTSKAASELGKLGGEASAKAKAKAAREAKKAEKESEPESAEPEVEAVTAEPAAEPEKAEPAKKDRRGDPRHDPRARMHEATREAAELKRVLAEERRERERMAARLEALERGERPEDKPKPKIFDPAKPAPEDFEDYEDYLDARDEYNRRKWDDGQRRRFAEAQEEQTFVGQARSFIEKVKEAVPDFSERMAPAVLKLRPHFALDQSERPDGTNFLASELFYSPDSAPGVMLYLSEHPEELDRIGAMATPREVSRAVGRIEDRLEAAAPAGNGEGKEKPTSKAAPPIKPVSGASVVADDEDYKPGMSLDAYATIWNRKHRMRK